MTTIEELANVLSEQQVQISELLKSRRLDEDPDPSDYDVFWLIFGGVLVFWMQAGFAMLEVGTVHKKNTKNILIKNMFDASIAALAWWLIGHALAGSAGDSYPRSGNGGFAASEGFAYTGTDAAAGKGQAEAGWFFAWTFAGAAATIVSGSVAERCSFSGYLIYSAVLTSIIYPPVVHTFWGNGRFAPWRSQGQNGGDGKLYAGCGVTDFAGSGVVHMTGGVAALVGAAMIGPRKGRFEAGYKLPTGDPVLQSLGVFILWMGWYGFNAVSTLAINGLSSAAAHCCVTTTISAATACLVTALIGFYMKHEIDHSMVNNGVLAGLVSITAGCPVVSIAGAFCIGFIGAFVYVGASLGIKALKIDDVVDAVAVHGACGAWGVIAVGWFATPVYYSMGYYSERNKKCAGLFYGGTGATMQAALVAVGVIFLWVGSTSTILFGTLKLAGLLRVSAEVEEMGMDASKHGGRIDLPAAAPTKESVV